MRRLRAFSVATTTWSTLWWGYFVSRILTCEAVFNDTIFGEKAVIMKAAGGLSWVLGQFTFFNTICLLSLVAFVSLVVVLSLD